MNILSMQKQKYKDIKKQLKQFESNRTKIELDPVAQQEYTQTKNLFKRLELAKRLTDAREKIGITMAKISEMFEVPLHELIEAEIEGRITIEIMFIYSLACNKNLT